MYKSLHLNYKSLLFLLLISCVLASCSSTRKHKEITERKMRERKALTSHKSKSSHRKESYSSKTKRSANNPKKTVNVPKERRKLVRSAMNYIGVNYVYGGKSPTGFDCSGLTTYVYQQHGISLKGSTRDQIKIGKSKSLDEAEAGDLIFFKNNGRIVHVSIVAENLDSELWVVHSTSSRGVVKDEILNSSYWRPKVAGVRDILD